MSQQSNWGDALVTVARHYRVDCSLEDIRLAEQWSQSSNLQDKVRQMARRAGLRATFTKPTSDLFNTWRLPLIVQLKDGQVGVLESISSHAEAGVVFGGEEGQQTPIAIDKLLNEADLVVVVRPLKGVRDARVDTYIEPYQEDWFRRIIIRDLKPYSHIMIASLVANVLGLAGILFTTQVYDRVVPAASYPTLYVLFAGVLIAILFDFIMRVMRMKIADVLGKRADIRVSDLVFGHAVRLKNSARPRSTGSFIAQLRELEQVRDLITSSTAAALADFPFFLLFLVIFALVGGHLVWVPIGAFFLLFIPGLFAQKPLARLANESMRESSLRQATLVETVQGAEDIKALQAENRFQQQWNYYNAVTAETNLKMRTLTNRLVVWTHCIQGGVYAVVVALGAPIVMDGDMTTGTLVAVSILASRMMIPVAQLTHVMTRWQQAKIALKGLHALMKLPVDYPEHSKKVHMANLSGAYSLREACFSYGESDPALEVRQLSIKPGERVAILGRNGAGKSTLLQALAGGMDLQSGVIDVDGVALQHIDPNDVRRDVALLTQNARLFHGSLRENLTLGAPQSSDQDILMALQVVGADEFVYRLPDGLEYLLQEGGVGLSNGQRQLLLLARLIIRQPNVLLLDEPTSCLDEITERNLLKNLATWSKGRTLIISTHRMAVLSLVDRMVVLESGKILLDDSKKNALLKLKSPSGKGEVASV